MLFANGTATSWNAQTLVVLTASCICSTMERHLKNRMRSKIYSVRQQHMDLFLKCKLLEHESRSAMAARLWKQD
ncbi:hypothetical protein VNO78_15850 [Psophocarpus tetragonolobus]|uniref:Uncharacterized protein n=1 Tax=Psophocarpus tetragonolobus TaxID=3891 RepID=A0AAN9SGS9_PSOTE